MPGLQLLPFLSYYGENQQEWGGQITPLPPGTSTHTKIRVNARCEIWRWLPDTSNFNYVNKIT